MNDVLRLPANQMAGFAEDKIYLIGNATTLIRFAGFTILTSPAFRYQGGYACLGHGICLTASGQRRPRRADAS